MNTGIATDWKTKIGHLQRALDRGDRITVAGLGDSLTYGWMVSQGFFERFLLSLTAHWPDATIKGIAAGVPGDTAAGGLRRLAGVLDQNPNLVLVQFGLNDFFSGVGLASFEKSYEQITNDIIADGPIPILVVSSPLPHSLEQDNATRYYDIIRNLGQKLGVAVADTDHHFRNSAEYRDNPDRLYLDDGSHPSDEGHRLMADALTYLFM
ncbi:MAG: SGNH/GDSL hydrolase family protein [Proteobacteria bacterium]|nr:SGNH/GDSL hydrolase family protein [Pseudomonadota bacterium]